MYHTDPNINLSIERAADRMHAVRGYGLFQGQTPVAAFQPKRGEQAGWRPALQVATTLVAIVVLAGAIASLAIW
jgi:hypothetical protein